MSTVIEQEIGVSKANLEVFSSTLQELAQIDKDIIVVTSDSRGSDRPLGAERRRDPVPDQHGPGRGRQKSFCRFTCLFPYGKGAGAN